MNKYLLIAIATLWCVAAGCSRGKTSSAGGEVAGKGADSGSATGEGGATPVTMGQVVRGTLEVTVSGPGQVDALQDERVRAPFNGKLVSLRVQLGDHVRQGESVGEIIAQNSEAALVGAQAMMRSASTPAERSDAERALALAEKNLVRTALPAPRTGVVIARPASPGELVTEGDSIVSIGATNSMAFFAAIAQSDLSQVRSGEPAWIELSSGGPPIRGVVKRVLPSDTGSTGGMRVQIDLVPRAIPVTIGLYGTAHIIVDEHRNVPVVPRSALLRDDVTGTTKLALVTPQNEARWVVVRPGISDSAWAEIVSPSLRMGQRVITTGQVGLPDSAKVVAMVDSTESGGAGGGNANGAGGANASGATGGQGAASGANGGVAPEGAGGARGGVPATGGGSANGTGGAGAAPAAGGAATPGNARPTAGAQGGQARGDASPGAATTHAPAGHAPTPGAPATGGARRPDL